MAFENESMVQRFAVSGLSKERKDEALNEEILIGKYTGEFFIKSKDGIVISTDILNRLKSSTENAIRLAEYVGMSGELYHIDFDNLVLPSHIDYSVNIIQQEQIQLPTTTKKILLNIDCDEFDIIGDEIKPVNTQAVVKITVGINGVDTIFEKSIGVVNSSILELGDIQNVTSVIIKSIVIEKENKEYNSGYNDRTIILHNLFVTIN